jgi:hypothetical protein
VVLLAAFDVLILATPVSATWVVVGTLHRAVARGRRRRAFIGFFVNTLRVEFDDEQPSRSW